MKSLPFPKYKEKQRPETKKHSRPGHIFKPIRKFIAHMIRLSIVDIVKHILSTVTQARLS